MKKKIFRILGIVLTALLLFIIVASQITVAQVVEVKIIEPVIQKSPINLQPQDSHTRSLLTEQGIDPEYVELVQDYGKTLTTAEKDVKEANPLTKGLPAPNPYSKTFQDRISGKYIAEIQQLPMVNANGVKVNASWTLSGGTYTAGANQFTASVTGNTTTLTVFNDQPTDIKSGASLRVSPVVYLNGKIVNPKSATPTLLAVDPVNENYVNNTLVWDYGICKRYLRLIEGSILGRWEFANNPKGEVRIVYNQAGDFNLKLGQYATNNDTEVIPAKVFNSAQYPFEVSDSQTFYPDADPETSSVDGYIRRNGAGVSWATLIAATGTSASDSIATSNLAIMADTVANKWVILDRNIFLYNTSALGANASVISAVFSVYGTVKNDGLSITPDINVYSSNPASNTALVAADFVTLGLTAFCDTAITYAAYPTSGYMNYTLNASGIAAINVTGITKLGTRNANYDVSGTPPVWVSGSFSYLGCYFSEQGTGYKPKLVVTYTIPAAPTITLSAATLITGTTARLNGNVTDTGGENPTVTMYWGDNDGGQVAGDWDNNSAPTSPAQPQGVAAFYKDVTGLTSSTVYYFSAKGVNSYGTGWAVASLNFRSQSLIAKIIGILVDNINIIW